jgi:hypothetical protein
MERGALNSREGKGGVLVCACRLGTRKRGASAIRGRAQAASCFALAVREGRVALTVELRCGSKQHRAARVALIVWLRCDALFCW